MDYEPKIRTQRVPLSQLLNEAIINKEDLPTYAEKLFKSIFYSNIKDRELQQQFISNYADIDLTEDFPRHTPDYSGLQFIDNIVMFYLFSEHLNTGTATKPKLAKSSLSQIQ